MSRKRENLLIIYFRTKETFYFEANGTDDNVKKDINQENNNG